MNIKEELDKKEPVPNWLTAIIIANSFQTGTSVWGFKDANDIDLVMHPSHGIDINTLEPFSVSPYATYEARVYTIYVHLSGCGDTIFNLIFVKDAVAYEAWEYTTNAFKILAREGSTFRAIIGVRKHRIDIFKAMREAYITWANERNSLIGGPQ